MNPPWFEDSESDDDDWMSQNIAKYEHLFMYKLEPLYTLLSESSLVDFVSISHTAKRLPPKIRICLVCYQKEI